VACTPIHESRETPPFLRSAVSSSCCRRLTLRFRRLGVNGFSLAGPGPSWVIGGPSGSASTDAPAERPLPARNGYRRRMEAPASRQGSVLEVSATGAGRCRAGWPVPGPSSRPQPPGPGAGALGAVKAVPPRGPPGAWTRGRTLPLLRIVFAGVTESTKKTPGGWRSISCCSAARCIAARRPVEVSTRYRGPPCFASNVRPLSSMQPRFLQR
jgi:hypothetical protein